MLRKSTLASGNGMASARPSIRLHTRQSSASHHAGTRIDAHHQAGITHQFHGFARHQTGADADVDDPHTRFRPCSLA
jgi:hypothetical protein